ncbi:hypothetical protein KHA80_15995 [Anaerobacillus sp. HL2]|nr:hypothetical protein KHA80_15995 [Anaerobacillus sp. HL2]
MVLLAAGVELSKLIEPGMAIMVKVNERLISIPGEHGKAPVLEKNEQACHLDDPLPNRYVFVQSGTNGKSAHATVKEMSSKIYRKKTIFINEKKYELQSTIVKNGKRTTLTEFVEDRDEIAISCLILLKILTSLPTIRYYS